MLYVQKASGEIKDHPFLNRSEIAVRIRLNALLWHFSALYSVFVVSQLVYTSIRVCEVMYKKKSRNCIDS